MTTVVKRVARATLIDDDQRLLLIKRTKPGQEPYWTAPGGGIEPDDPSAEGGLIRELREELGAEASAALLCISCGTARPRPSLRTGVHRPCSRRL